MNTENNKIIIGDRFLFDPNDNSLIDTLNDDEIIRLGGNESRVLSLLIQEPGKVVSRHELHEYVWRDQGFEVDDSSLTQAISTLRKMLQDPTKLPVYVKTVPKRGYQFISTAVTQVDPDQQTEAETEHNLENTPSIDSLNTASVHQDDAQEAQTVAPQQNATINQPSTTNSTPQAHLSLLGTIMLIIAFVLPIIAYVNHTPKSDAFVEVANYDNTPVFVPVNHPSIEQWKPLIEQCTNFYNSKHTDSLKPIEVIATSGQPNQITLNYIHSEEHSDQSISVRLLIDQKGVDKVCG
ncbi:transcriptional regulator [Aliivibrio fischeri]|uniref:winged helix-turn-helix domain-containing protein n=1 Tax=Aliivibrio fischeri TaxID=668 RepID=UPI0012D8F074|nr:transcriptional regulator [Aliivibrio fischeri]MUL01446.1 transcriptional regulator [Aliivibrio fischeri]